MAAQNPLYPRTLNKSENSSNPDPGRWDLRRSLEGTPFQNSTVLSVPFSTFNRPQAAVPSYSPAYSPEHYNLAPVDDMEVREYRAEDEKPNNQLSSINAATNKNNASHTPNVTHTSSVTNTFKDSNDMATDETKPQFPSSAATVYTAESSLQPSLTTIEWEALKKILNTTGQELPPNLNCNPVDLIQKLHTAREQLANTVNQLKENEQKAIAERDLEREAATVIHRQLTEDNAKHKSVMDEVIAQAMMVRDRLKEQEVQRKDNEAERERQYREQENTRKELEALKLHRSQMLAVFKEIREFLICAICTEVAILPKVLGTCGHITCQNCLKKLDDVAFSSLTTTAGGASARQHLLARRCPLCRVEIVGQAFPVLPLKDVASLLIGHGYIEVAEQAAVQKHIDAKAIAYERESAEAKHIAALQLGCYAQSQLAQHSVNGVLAKVSPEQWVNGVYVLFEAAVTRVFFETFATTLHGKAGGVNVLVNASQRMLAVQLIDKSRNVDPDRKGGHMLIKVATDGRFVITTTPAQPAHQQSASASSSAAATQPAQPPQSAAATQPATAAATQPATATATAPNFTPAASASMASNPARAPAATSGEPTVQQPNRPAM